MINRDRLIEQFLTLVQIDSETKHEAQISEYLQALFAKLGLEVKVDDTAAVTGHGSGNLIMTLPASEGLQQVDALFFTCHMDTVAPGNQIKPQLGDDGYIRSDGTTILGSDDKAGISVMIECIEVLREKQMRHGPIQFIITAGEESGLVGSRAMKKEDVSAKFGYALDSNGAVGHVAVAAPAQAKITIHVYGKMAHAGVNPEDGISAIQVASRAISRMHLGRIDHETTANIGSFAGGKETNIVCDYVEIKAEARSIQAAKLDQQIKSMRTAVMETAEEFGTEAEFLSEIIYPGYQFDPSDKIVQLVKRATDKVGIEMKTFHSGGGSDANIFNGMGIPTVNLAVGYENIHTKEERIAVDDIVTLAQLVVAIVEQSAVQ